MADSGCQLVGEDAGNYGASWNSSALPTINLNMSQTSNTTTELAPGEIESTPESFLPLGVLCCGAAAASPGSRLGGWIALVAIIVLVMVRMYLTANDGIVPQSNDAQHYAAMVANYLTGNDLDGFPVNRPGIALVAKALEAFGIPFKMFLDVLLITVAILAGASMFAITRSRMLAMLLMLCLMANAWFLSEAVQFMTEPLTSILLLCQGLIAISLLAPPVHRWQAWLLPALVVVVSVSVLVRNEMPVLACFWLLVFLICIYRYAREHGWSLFRRVDTLKIVCILLPLAAGQFSLTTLKWVHGACYGIQATSQVESPGVNQLMQALYTIPPEEELRYAPVTRQSLAAACDVSPTLNRYRKKLLDTDRPAYLYGARNLGLKEEFGSWLNWHLIGSFRNHGYNENLEMLAAAKEIRDAQARGEIAHRAAIYPVCPLWKQWLPELPGQVGQGLADGFIPAQLLNEGLIAKRHPDNVIAKGYFDDSLSVRHGAAYWPTIRVAGKKRIGSTSFHSVRLLDGEGNLLVEAPITTDAKSVHAFSIELNDAEYFQDGSQSGKEVLQLQFVRQIRSETNTNSSRISNHVVLDKKMRAGSFYRDVRIESDDDAADEGWQIDYASSWPLDDHRVGWKKQLIKLYRPIVAVSIFLAMTVGLVAGWKDARQQTGGARTLQLRNVGWVVFAMAAFVLGRCVFYCLIEVWLHWGVQRYVVPNAFLSVLLVLTAAWLGGALLGRRFGRRA